MKIQFPFVKLIIVLSGICALFIIGANNVMGDYISISSPYGGETWYQGEYHYINWYSEYAGDYVNIGLYKDGIYDSSIAFYADNDGSYYWQVPYYQTESYYYAIRIESTSDGYIYGESNYFTIFEDFNSGSSVYNDDSYLDPGDNCEETCCISLIIVLIIIVAVIILYKEYKKNEDEKRRKQEERKRKEAEQQRIKEGKERQRREEEQQRLEREERERKKVDELRERIQKMKKEGYNVEELEKELDSYKIN